MWFAIKKRCFMASEVSYLGFRINKNGVKKMCCMASEVSYLGFRINKNGVNPLPEKVADLPNAETPKNIMQLKSFLGMLNY